MTAKGQTYTGRGTLSRSGLRSRVSIYDQILFQYRSGVALVFTLILVFFVVKIVIIQLATPAPSWVPLASFTVSDDLTALLATGTASLGYAALVQAVSAEKLRIGQSRPLISISASTKSGPLRLGSEFLDPESPPQVVFVLENLGPGSAVAITAWLHLWVVPAGQPIPPTSELPNTALPIDESFRVVDYTTLGSGRSLGELSLAAMIASRKEAATKEWIKKFRVTQLVLQVRYRSIQSAFVPHDELFGAYIARQKPPSAENPTIKWRSMSMKELRDIGNLPELEYQEFS